MAASGRSLALAGLALATLLAAGLPYAAARQPTDFPWCSCSTYDCDCSPYKISLTSQRKVNETITRFCFNVDSDPCDTSRACCRRMMANVDKLSFKIAPECQRVNIQRITFNGDRWNSWDTYSHDLGNGDKGYELKFYDIQSNSSAFPGTRICVNTISPCSSVFQICDGPNGLCDAAIQICLTVEEKGCKNDKAACCDMDFNKISIPIVDSCQPKIREMRVNGVKHEYSWLQRDGNQNIALRNMRAYLPNPIGAQICIVVLPGQCAAPAGLCKDGTCKVTIWNSNNKCCPSTKLGLASRGGKKKAYFF
eukprot:XP_001697284.1 predicted protein [Chlamydomonas reinhardtii]